MAVIPGAHLPASLINRGLCGQGEILFLKSAMENKVEATPCWVLASHAHMCMHTEIYMLTYHPQAVKYSPDGTTESVVIASRG